MMLAKNMVLKWFSDHQEGDDHLERILWIASNGEYLYTFDIDDYEQVLPVRRDSADIEQAIKNGDAIVFSYSDEFLKLPEDGYTPTQRKNRDEAWKLIEPIVNSGNGEDVFIPAKRGKLIAEVSKQSGLSKHRIYLKLRRYWRGGQVRNALIQHQFKSGTKTGQEVKQNGEKRGRKRNHGTHPGTNVNETTKKLLQKGYKRFYASGECRTLTQAFNETIRTFFKTGEHVDQDGVTIPVLAHIEERPTINQFKYHCHKGRDKLAVLENREGKSRSQANHGPKLGSAALMAFGPNSWFLIDSTPADCILVNPFDRSQELGKSTLYFIKDLFSFMITGFLVTNEEASWISQVLAFQTVVQDKVELCAQYGITIKPEDWPCIFLPDFLLEDRGEGESKYANLFANVLGVQISNTPPYRPDLKGPVELDFHLANQYALHKLEGGGPPPQKRGEKDRRGLPCLILEELIYIVIHYILTYNSTHTLDEYPFDEFMIQDKVDPVPLALWNWGIENRTGFGRVMNPETVYQALLPREFVSVSQKGINYQGLYYFSEYGAENQWYLKAGRKTGFKTLQVQIAYDPRTTNYIFVCDPQGKVIERCQLTDRSKAYANISRAEYRAQKKCEDDRRVELDNREFEAELVLDARLDHIQIPAREKAEEAREKAGKAKKATSKDRRANKSEEREWRRKIDTTQDGDVKTVSGLEEAEIKPATDRVPNQHTYFAPPDYGDLIDAIDDDDQGD